MPTDTIVVVAAIVTVFALFACALFYADYQTRQVP